jgi:hypothetical protein
VKTVSLVCPASERLPSAAVVFVACPSKGLFLEKKKKMGNCQEVSKVYQLDKY